MADRIIKSPAEMLNRSFDDVTESFAVNIDPASVDPQHPIKVDGDSVYEIDVDFDNSDFTGWTGDPTQLFQSPFSTSITNASGDNPKFIILAFKRTVNAVQVGLGENNGGDFSNVKVSLLGSSGAERSVFNDQNNDNKKTSLNAVMGDELFNSIKIEFFTSDRVDLSNITIQKAKYSVIQNNVQNPLPLGDDSVYCKDLDLLNSDIGDFDGDVCTLFNNYKNNNVAASVGSGGANPKSFTLVFNRPILSSTIGIGSPDTSISNAKLTLKGLNNIIIKTVDFSTNDTKEGILVFQFEQTIFLEAQIEFFTDDEVVLGGATILKSGTISIDAINGVISNDNSTKIPLLANTSFTGTFVDTKNYGIIVCSVYSDVVSAIDGLVIEFSTDKTNWFWNDKYTIPAATGKTFSVQTQARFMRVTYLNGPTDQTVFQMEVTLKPVYIKPSSHRVGDSISPEDDAELSKAVLSGQSELTGIFENVATFRKALKVDNALVHSQGIDVNLHRETGVATTLNLAVSVGDTTLDVVSAVGFNIGDDIHLPVGEETGEFFFRITNIVGTIFTLDMPVIRDIIVGMAVEVVSYALNVVGSLASPVIFNIAPPPGSIWQITRTLISITDNSAMDDGLFGSLGALTNGVVLRSKKNGVFGNQINWKTNGDMALTMFDVSYTSKAPSGENGLRGRWTFTKSEFAIELNGDTNDELQLLIQDDLSTLSSYGQKLQGRLFGG